MMNRIEMIFLSAFAQHNFLFEKKTTSNHILNGIIIRFD